MYKFVSPLHLALALTFAVACGSAEDQALQGQLAPDEAVDMVIGAQNVPGPATLPGSLYTIQGSPAVGAITVLRLGADRSFQRQTALICAQSPCAPVITEGNYVLTHSTTGTAYVRFMRDGVTIDRFSYTLDHGILSLHNVASSQSFQLQREAVAGEHCGGIDGLNCGLGLHCMLTADQQDTGGTCN